MLTGITHLALTVKDMDRSVDFYCRVLGLKKAFEIAEPDTGAPWIVYLHLAKSQFVELFYNGTRENPWEPELRGFNHICFEVDDIHKTAEHIKNAGYKLDKEPRLGADKNWQCWVTDPDGVRIELMQISPESPHAKAAGSLPL
ncbi:VOC family protein [Treponema sp. OttesenSCG-928-L16]|nr:VOC family protein [Treponema sp. OttesenSCG-928-L16]